MPIKLKEISLKETINFIHIHYLILYEMFVLKIRQNSIKLILLHIDLHYVLMYHSYPLDIIKRYYLVTLSM